MLLNQTSVFTVVTFKVLFFRVGLVVYLFGF